jgi:hypothetical protein
LFGRFCRNDFSVPRRLAAATVEAPSERKLRL